MKRDESNRVYWLQTRFLSLVYLKVVFITKVQFSQIHAIKFVSRWEDIYLGQVQNVTRDGAEIDDLAAR